MLPCNFPASSCSLRPWIKCLLPVVSSSVLFCLVEEEGARLPGSPVSSPGMINFLDLADISSTRLFLRTCPSAELYFTEAGSGLVTHMSWTYGSN